MPRSVPQIWNHSKLASTAPVDRRDSGRPRCSVAPVLRAARPRLARRRAARRRAGRRRADAAAARPVAAAARRPRSAGPAVRATGVGIPLRGAGLARRRDRRAAAPHGRRLEDDQDRGRPMRRAPWRSATGREEPQPALRAAPRLRRPRLGADHRPLARRHASPRSATRTSATACSASWRSAARCIRGAASRRAAARRHRLRQPRVRDLRSRRARPEGVQLPRPPARPRRGRALRRPRRAQPRQQPRRRLRHAGAAGHRARRPRARARCRSARAPRSRPRSEPQVVTRLGLRVAFVGFSDIGPAVVLRRPRRARARRARRSRRSPPACARPAARADVVVATFHWGVERATSENARQRAFAQAALNAGASAVIGAHPHVLQPVRRLAGRRLIAYSLGNFVWSAGSAATARTGILRLGLSTRGVESSQAAAGGHRGHPAAAAGLTLTVCSHRPH